MPEYSVRLRSKETNKSRKVSVFSSSYSDAEKEATRVAGDKDKVEEIDNINFCKNSFNVIDRK